MKRIAALLFALVILSTSLTARSQVHIQFYSSTTGALPADCQAEAAVLSPLLGKYHSPSWTWVVACDEAAWTKIADHIGFTFETVTHGSQPLAATDLSGKTTYVRGFALIHIFSDDIVAQPRHIVAHELGHITLNTHNEAKAEHQCMVLLNEPTVIASRGELQ
jgi:hypothetical protein